MGYDITVETRSKYITMSMIVVLQCLVGTTGSCMYYYYYGSIYITYNTLLSCTIYIITDLTCTFGSDPLTYLLYTTIYHVQVTHNFDLKICMWREWTQSCLSVVTTVVPSEDHEHRNLKNALQYTPGVNGAPYTNVACIRRLLKDWALWDFHYALTLE